MLHAQVKYRRESNKAAELERSKQYRKAAKHWELAGFKAQSEKLSHWCKSRVEHCMKMADQNRIKL